LNQPGKLPAWPPMIAGNASTAGRRHDHQYRGRRPPPPYAARQHANRMATRSFFIILPLSYGPWFMPETLSVLGNRSLPQ
jgi:hypothetical protein